MERRKRGPQRSNAKVKNVGTRKGGRGSKQQKSQPSTSSTAINAGGTRASARAYKNFLKDAGVLPDSDDERKSKKSPPKHCGGPGCIYQARPSSKYCSDECGMKLAQK